MKKLKSLLKNLRNPSRKVLIIFVGLIGVAGGYAWARYTFDDNVANSNPNTVAGYVIITGVAVVLYGVLESHIKSHTAAIAKRNKRKKKQPKTAKKTKK